MKAHVVSPSLTSAVPDLSRSQSSPSQSSVQIKTPIQEIEKARNDEDDVADERGKRKRLRLDKDEITPTPAEILPGPPPTSTNARCHRPTLFIDTPPLIVPDHRRRSASNPRGRYPVFDAERDARPRHFHEVIPPTPDSLDMAQVVELRSDFGRWICGGSLSDGYQARLTAVRAASTAHNTTTKEGDSSPLAREVGPMTPDSADNTPSSLTLDVVVKLVRPEFCVRKRLRKTDVWGQVLAEAELYTTRMVPLQGIVVPRFYGVWTLEQIPCPSDSAHEDTRPGTGPDCILTILEHVGEPWMDDRSATRENMDEADRERIREAHRALHRVGVVHHHASHKMPHTMLDSQGRIRLIDFERSKRCKPVVDGELVSWAVMEEMEMLDRFLGGEW